MSNVYTFRIEKAEYADRVGRDIRVYACKDGWSHSLPTLNKVELKELARTINEYLQ